MKRASMLMMAVILLMSLTLIAAMPPQETDQTHFAGKAVCVTVKSGETFKHDGKLRQSIRFNRLRGYEVVRQGTIDQCVLTTNDPKVSGKLTISNQYALVAPKHNGAGFVYAHFELKNGYTDWQGWLIQRIDQNGVKFTNAWAYATRGSDLYGKHAHFRLTVGSPTIVQGMYGR